VADLTGKNGTFNYPMGGKRPGEYQYRKLPATGLPDDSCVVTLPNGEHKRVTGVAFEKDTFELLLAEKRAPSSK